MNYRKLLIGASVFALITVVLFACASDPCSPEGMLPSLDFFTESEEGFSEISEQAWDNAISTPMSIPMYITALQAIRDVAVEFEVQECLIGTKEQLVNYMDLDIVALSLMSQNPTGALAGKVVSDIARLEFQNNITELKEEILE